MVAPASAGAFFIAYLNIVVGSEHIRESGCCVLIFFGGGSREFYIHLQCMIRQSKEVHFLNFLQLLPNCCQKKLKTAVIRCISITA